MAMQELGFEEMEEYAIKRQNTVVQYIATRPIMELYKDTVRMLGMWVERGGGNRRAWTWQKQGRQRRQQKKRGKEKRRGDRRWDIR